MTFDEFFTALEATGFKFRVGNGYIRTLKGQARGRGCLCPLEAVAFHMGEERRMGLEEFGLSIGLSSSDIYVIIAAADDFLLGIVSRHQEIRTRLLELCETK